MKMAGELGSEKTSGPSRRSIDKTGGKARTRPNRDYRIIRREIDTRGHERRGRKRQREALEGMQERAVG